MDKNTLFQDIRRKATQFTTGGFRPTNTREESWIGRVFICKAEEEPPLDSDGRLMIPLAQFYLPKIGDWPSFCQSGVDFEAGYSFVFQRSTDAKANRNVVDNGSFLFAFNPSIQQWQLYYDFY